MAKRSASAPESDLLPDPEETSQAATAVMDDPTPDPTPTDTDAAAPATPAPVADPAVESDVWRQRLERAGFSDLPETVDEEAFLSITAQERQRRMAAEQSYQAMAARLQAIEQAQQRQPQAQAEPAKPWFHKHWNPPQINRQWLQEYVQDGKLVPETPLEIAQKIREYVAYQQDFRQKFSENPYETLYQGLRERLIEDVQSVSQQAVGGYELTQWAGQTRQEIAPWAFAYDANGALIRDAMGAPVRTEAGQRFAAYLIQAGQMGIPDIRAQYQYARNMMDRDYFAANVPPQQQRTAAQTQAETNAAHLAKHTGHKPSRAGTLRTAADPNGPPQNPDDILAGALALAREQGLDLAADAA